MRIVPSRWWLSLPLVLLGSWPLWSAAQSAGDAGSSTGTPTSSVAAPTAPGGLPLTLTGDIELGGFHDSVTNNYGDWNGEFVRLVAPLGSSDTLNAELVNSREFHDSGTLLTVGDTHVFTDRTFAQVSVATSTEGYYLPTGRIDAAIDEKWLDHLQLVTNIGVSFIDYRGGYSDRALTFGAAYYLSSLPLVMEAGARVNQASPGDVDATTGFVAATYGTAGQHFISLRYGFGREAYQLVGSNQVLTDFSSNDVLLTWRQWIAANQGFQVRVEAYSNPYYRRTGLEASWFHDF